MTPEFLVLAHVGDAGASEVVAALTWRFGESRVVWLRPEMLSVCRWTHRVQSDGAATTTVILPSGVTLDSARVKCVFNRITAVPMPLFARSNSKNRDYAIAEFYALLTSWFTSFGDRMVNPAAIIALLAGPRPFRAWMLDAVACDLPVGCDARATAGRLLATKSPKRSCPSSAINPALPAGLAGALPVHQMSASSCAVQAGYVLVAGDAVFGPLADIFGAGCLRLARHAGCRLAAFHFAHANGELVLSGVDSTPALTSAVEVEAAARLLVATARCV